MELLWERNKVETISSKVGLDCHFVAHKIHNRYLKYPAGGIGYGKTRLLTRFLNDSGFKVVKQSVEAVMGNNALREALCLGDFPIEAPCLVRDGQQVTRVMAFHHDNLCDKVVQDGTLFEKWIIRKPSETTAAHLQEFLSLVSDHGNTLHDCVPRKGRSSRTTETRGQSVIQEGTMITASKHNARSYLLGNDGKLAPPNGFFLVRGKINAPNGTAQLPTNITQEPAHN